jgi:signal transduction histidine kinase
MKHSGASLVTMSAIVNDKDLQLTITENGKGFDFEKASKESAGFGLRGLVSRTEMIGGHMYLDSVPGKGTKYTFVIPI